MAEDIDVAELTAKPKVGIGGFLALILAIILFSGVFYKMGPAMNGSERSTLRQLPVSLAQFLAQTLSVKAVLAHDRVSFLL